MEISHSYVEYRPRIIEMMEEFKKMSNGHLGKIKVSKNRIELTPPEARPIHSVPYGAGPATRTFEKTEIDSFLGMDVTELA